MQVIQKRNSTLLLNIGEKDMGYLSINDTFYSFEKPTKQEVILSIWYPNIKVNPYNVKNVTYSVRDTNDAYTTHEYRFQIPCPLTGMYLAFFNHKHPELYPDKDTNIRGGDSRFISTKGVLFCSEGWGFDTELLEKQFIGDSSQYLSKGDTIHCITTITTYNNSQPVTTSSFLTSKYCPSMEVICFHV